MTFRALGQVFLLCLGVTAVLYGRTFGFDWTYDDFMVIVDNPDVRSWANFLADGYPGRPLRELTYLLDHALFGLEPAGWRVQQLFWHALCGALLFELARRLTGEVRAGLVAALLFLIHPLQVEVVANLSHRKDSLALAFCLLALLLWMRGYEGRRPWGWRAGALLAWGVALLAKENAVVVPLLWLLYEWRFVPAPERLLLRLPAAPVLYPAGLVAAGVLWCWQQGGAVYYREYVGHLLKKLEYFGTPDLALYLQTMLKAWAFMALRVVWPADLAVEYLFPVPASWLDPWVLGGLACTAAVIGLTVWGFMRRRPAAVFWGGWLALFWLPTSNLWPIAYFAADRYLYPIVAGLAALLGWWLCRTLPRPAALAAVTLAIVLPLAAVSWQQVGYWRDDDTLHRHALAVSPHSSFLNNELGKIAEKRGDVPAAMGYYRAALERHPGNAAAHYNLGRLYEFSGFLAKALEHYQAFLRDDTPAYRDTARDLAERLRREHGLIFKGAR